MPPLRGSDLALEDVFDGLLHAVFADFAHGGGDGNVFGADFYAKLGVAAFLDTAVSHEGVEAVFFQSAAGGVVVEEFHLRDGGGADEVGLVVELGAGLHAAAAGHAAGDGIHLFLRFGKLAGTGAEIVGSVDGDPGFDALEIFKEDAAVDLKIADERKLGEGLDFDGLLELIHEGRACHTDFAVDAHGAGSADLFEAVGVVADGRGGFAVLGDGIESDVAHGGDYVHALVVGDLEGLPGGGGIRRGLATDLESDCAVRHDERSAIRD